jgi:MFS superfamily sulfate permease-like transporter
MLVVLFVTGIIVGMALESASILIAMAMLRRLEDRNSAGNSHVPEPVQIATKAPETGVGGNGRRRVTYLTPAHEEAVADLIRVQSEPEPEGNDTDGLE